MSSIKEISIVGIVGLPASYGGFETLVENLVKHQGINGKTISLTVYCSSKAYSCQPQSYLTANLRYLNIKANGISSIFYDIAALIDSVRRNSETILLLGVSGAIVLPFIRIISKAKIVTNVDGIEWKREKWGRFARSFLKLSERIAVNYSDVVIADNTAIEHHINTQYGKNCVVIAYGGDHSISPISADHSAIPLPPNYYLGICRIEPENNIAMILEAFRRTPDQNILFVGNWQNSTYGKQLRDKYSQANNIFMVDPIYDQGLLKLVRERAKGYVHGHSAGGTNPSLVEMMFFRIPIYAYDCPFNRYTTGNHAIFFKNSNELEKQLRSTNPTNQVGEELFKIADQNYRWSQIAESYFNIL